MKPLINPNEDSEEILIERVFTLGTSITLTVMMLLLAFVR